MTAAAVVIALFFAIGIIVGAVAVVAVSVLHWNMSRDPDDPDDPSRYGPDGPGSPPQDLDWSGLRTEEIKENPRWQSYGRD